MPLRTRAADGAVTGPAGGHGAAGPGPAMERLLEKLPPGRAPEVGSPRPRAGQGARGQRFGKLGGPTGLEIRSLGCAVQPGSPGAR